VMRASSRAMSSRGRGARLASTLSHRSYSPMSWTGTGSASAAWVSRLARWWLTAWPSSASAPSGLLEPVSGSQRLR
jgi:hypothetical protein